MAASGGPSQRKISVSTLLYSTLGPGLSLLPSEEKVKDPNLAAGEGDREKEVSADFTGSDSSRPQRVSAPSGLPSEDGRGQANKLSTNGDLNRLYSSPASSLGQKGRLGFKSKAGAGSVSSMEQAEASMLPKQFSISVDEGSEVPCSPISRQFQEQISPRNSLEDPISPR